MISTRGGEAGAAGDRGAQVASGQAAWVSGEAAVGEQRRRAVDVEAAGKGGAAEVGRLKADRAAGFGFTLKVVGIEAVAGEVEAVPGSRAASMPSAWVRA